MEPVVIDIAGTAGQFFKWIAGQLLLLLAVIVVGLSASFLFTIGIEVLALRGADMRF
jgi:hypothetical protein